MHLAIADDLRDQIETGALAPGDQVPAAVDLAAKWGCSAGSARAALAVLKDEGRITGGRGTRATVRHPPERTTLSLSHKWSQIQKDLVLRPPHEREESGAIELTAGIPIAETEFSARYEVVHATEHQADVFGIELGDEVQKRSFEMVERKSGHRISWSVSYIPLYLIRSNPELLDDKNEPWPGGHQHQLYTVGVELDEFKRKLVAIQPTPGDRQKWGMDTGVAMILITTQSIDIQGRVVEYSEAVYPADRTEIEFSEPLKRWGTAAPKFQMGDN
ncbi:transcriptional regulator [Actinoalloteichus hymeniacidonis]|uniref:Transcriptional regulator n=1 Tax=Actinoalloteichus hymeniacidonis TaxID=340345 RepID=A0AAC9N0K9_9PSEU|nr:transcriptional regulator [Actinoalloteichus hymeniacidonis]